MNSSAGPPRVRISSVAGLLATVPHLLGFTPESSLVVVGVTRLALPPARANVG